MSRKRALVVIALGIIALYYLSDFSQQNPQPSNDLEARQELRVSEWKRRNFQDYMNKRMEIMRDKMIESNQKSQRKEEVKLNVVTEIEPGVFEKRDTKKHVIFTKDFLKKQIAEYGKGSAEEESVLEIVTESNSTSMNDDNDDDDDGTSSEEKLRKKQNDLIDQENRSKKISEEFDSKEISDILHDKKIKASHIVLNDWTKFDWKKFNQGCPKNRYKNKLKALLRAWIKIAKEHNIRYCLTYGSLVGALRNKDIIPHEKNIDIFISDVDYAALVKASQPREFDAKDGKIHLVIQEDYYRKKMNDRTRKSCRGKVVDRAVDHCAFQEPAARLLLKDLHIDIYPLCLGKAVVKDPLRHVMYKRSYLLPFQSCFFMGLHTFCPNDGLNLLSRYYGDSDPIRPLFKCTNGQWEDVDT